MKKVAIKFLVIVVALLFIFLVLEGIFRVTYKFKYSPKRRIKLPISTVYKLSEDKDLLYELKPKAVAEINGIRFETNSYGFRDKKYSLKKKHKRIIFVGDSITFGWDVELKDTYHKQLEQLMGSRGHDVDVMGMGVVGYNIFQDYHLIKKKVLRFKPDLIILQICPNDFQRRLDIKAVKKGEKFVLVPFHDISIPFVIKKAGISQFLMEHSHLFKFINYKLFLLLRKFNKDYMPKDMFLLAEKQSFVHLRKTKKLLDGAKIQFAVVSFPTRKLKKRYRYQFLRKKIDLFLQKLHVPHMDLYQAFNIESKEKIWTDRLHPNAVGNGIAAAKLMDFIIPLLKK